MQNINGFLNQTSEYSHFSKYIDENSTDQELINIYQFLISQKLDLALFESIIKGYGDKWKSNQILSFWHRKTIVDTIKHKEKIDVISLISESFNRYDVEFVFLKGVICGSYYPNPDTRIFIDFDVYVKEEQLEIATKALESIGYTENKMEKCGHHLSFYHEKWLKFELHYRSASVKIIKNKEYIEDQFLHNCIYRNINGTMVRTINEQLQVVYYIIHAINHIYYGGFNLRQLLDIHYVIENSSEDINWGRLEKDLRYMGIELIGKYMLTVCSKIYQTDVDKRLLIEKDDTYDEFMLYLIEDRKVGEKRDNNYHLDKAFGTFLSGKDLNKMSLFKIRMLLLFPKPSQLREGFKYAKKYPVLLPIAWIHRFFYYLFIEHDRFQMGYDLKIDQDYMKRKEDLLKKLKLK